MLTNFFGKSKPINFILVSVYLIVGCFFYGLFLNINEGLLFFQNQTLLLLIVIFCIFLLNFIVKKNYLTENNTYSIFFFACFMLILPLFFKNADVLISNMFLLLALRRIMSLSSEKNREKKILDASIWISLAALFNFWSILFFLILFISIIQQQSKNYKLVLIPIVGFLTISVLYTSYNLIQGKTFLWFLNIDTSISIDFLAYKTSSLIIAITFLAFLVVLTLIMKFINFSEIRLKEKSKSALLIIALILCLIIILIFPNKDGSEILYIMAPLAILTANFIEKMQTFWVKEMILWVVLIFPLIIAFV